jgi:hypothetical protein
MGRRNDRSPRPGAPRPDFEHERTLAAAEDDEASREQAGERGDTSCTCGSNEFLLEAYLHVVDGVPQSDLVEVETLSCPRCGREYEAVQAEDGRILRGEFVGEVELED